MSESVKAEPFLAPAAAAMNGPQKDERQRPVTIYVAHNLLWIRGGIYDVSQYSAIN